jgi:hypothetical protein
MDHTITPMQAQTYTPPLTLTMTILIWTLVAISKAQKGLSMMLILSTQGYFGGQQLMFLCQLSPSVTGRMLMVLVLGKQMITILTRLHVFVVFLGELLCL